ncbi:hypothetical protein ACTL6P_17285 [Endozoicomonas acroporae]|uniref:hypothetical protein n=1 Tax=Endozoicomonas acroporae TaxID=1701104 RepID=UPI000C7825DC|nr:hypothetical protein [Endozoicomonas acroporae]
MLDGISNIDIPLNAFAGRTNANRWTFDKMIRQLEPSDAVRILKELFIHFAIACPLYRKQFISILRSQFNLDQDPELVLFMVEKNPELMDFLLG